MPCLNTQYYYENHTQKCHDTCPNITYSQNSTSTCDNCSASCKTCLNAADNCTDCYDGLWLDTNNCKNCTDGCTKCLSATNCSSCLSDYYFSDFKCLLNCSTLANCDYCNKSVGGGSIYCTDCSDSFWLDNITCVKCSDECTTCQSATNCTSCISDYYLSDYKCLLNCSTLDNCEYCNRSSTVVGLYCTWCFDLYELDGNNICIPECGDGVMIEDEECDDNNTDNEDGCSSLCRVEDYFNCTNTTLTNASECHLNEIRLNYLSILKIKNENSFVTTFDISPKIPILSTINWQTLFTINTNTIVLKDFQFDAVKYQLKFKGAYSQNSNRRVIDLTTNFASQKYFFSTLN